jgi:Immunity protein 35
MNETEATAAAHRLLTAQNPGVPDPVLLPGAADHDWCWVVQWSTQRAVTTRDPADAPPPGIGPIAVDKATGEAFYLSSVPLPVALDLARASRRDS